MNSLLTIGRFAQLTGLTVRALRLYDGEGLLRPDEIDQKTGYRYYAEEQLERAELIVRLRQLDMPLDVIARFLAGSEAEREQLLALHRVALRDRITATSSALHDLEQMRGEVTMSVESHTAVKMLAMVRKTLTDQPVLRRWIAFPQETWEEVPMPRHFKEINDTLLRQGLVQAGPPYCAPGQPDEEGTVLCEAGIAVDRKGDSEGDIEAATLRGGEIASLVVYHPRADKMDGKAVVRSLWIQMASDGLVPEGDARWIFHTRPDADEQMLEVVWSIKV